MELLTERLILHPLTPTELFDWAENLPALERQLGISYQAEPMEGIFREIVRGQLAPTRDDAAHYAWHSFWLLIRAADRVVVGSADFKDAPNNAGETELGYGLGKAFEGCGYMTEAATAMCRWALSQPGVRAVIAETACDYLPSHHVLERCGFVRTTQGETLWWRKEG